MSRGFKWDDSDRNENRVVFEHCCVVCEAQVHSRTGMCSTDHLLSRFKISKRTLLSRVYVEVCPLNFN